MSRSTGVARRELIVRRVAEADPGLAAGHISAAVDAVATSGRALAVLATALAEGPGALRAGTPPSMGALVAELRARGSTLPEATCARCARAHPKLTASKEGGVCPRCRSRQLASACDACGVVKPVAGRGPGGAPLCAACAPRPRRACSICGRTRPIARRATGGAGEICDSCFKGPVATCQVCGRERPCNFVAVGRPICITCSPRRRSCCAHCGGQHPACAQWPEGPVCEACYRAALSRRGRCERCGVTRRLMSPPGPEARLCADCAHLPGLTACRTCGVEDRPYAQGDCVRCALAARARRVVGDLDGPLRPVYEAIAAAPQPYSAHNWLRSSAAAAILAEITSGDLAATHEALDAHPRRRGADYLRHLLVAHGVLAPRDDELARLEAWVSARLATVDDPARRRLLRSYATWRLLRRARRRAGHTDLAARTPTRHAKTCLNAAMAFLEFLGARGHDLAGTTQADIDVWLSEGPPVAPQVADFLDWAAGAKRSDRFAIPAAPRQPISLVVDEHRWALGRRLLHDDALDLGDRVAGCLVVLYGQQLSRIVALTRDQIVTEGGTTRLNLGAAPIDIPPPLDALLGRLDGGRRPYSGVGSPAASPWLFTGLDPGRPLTAYQLGQRLQRLGIEPAAARRAALAHLAGHLPAAVLARTLNMAPTTAVRWAHAVGGDWNTYAAELAEHR